MEHTKHVIHNDDISRLEIPRDEAKCQGTSCISSASGLKDDSARVLDHRAERALCFKLDIRLLPILAVMYLFNALDKGNIGNAQTAGLSTGMPNLSSASVNETFSRETLDLNFKPGQYNFLLSIFFVPYVIFAPPIAFIGKRYGPARILPVLMLAFGSLTLLSAATHDFGGLFALRWLLGMAEAAFFPLVIYYLTTFYRRGELARRLAVFYAASNIANAFSGLLAFGVFQINGGALKQWRYLFLLEGACTVLFAAFAWWYLPRSPAETRFFNEEEKALAYRRIEVDSSSAINEKIKFRDSFKIFRQPTSFVFLAIEICLGVPIQSVALFLPQIVQRLGRGTVTTNLYTVAPNCFMIYAAIDDVKAQFKLAYYACFMMTWGTSAPSVLLSTWYNNNIAHENRRILLTSIGVPLANLMGLVSSNIFREKDEPKYKPALVITGVFGATGAVLSTGLGLYMAWDNYRRNTEQGVKTDARDIPTRRLRDGPDSPEFRWFL
ncbi:hypothetical protein UREG_03606 [Uncinocarpus reesii 1704]|uniref:Major facilitator superfamily (MFS) profile domain-containing protein n=1 Tax=Uncinocarpus reesii (strain UAMH 1704) TaxID=336963 RepID=C4JL98_UNCRE|nr:uncharacterized protein UREG_03606 [Uncinocarpus reesii 1704]EEP78760.1 hypothetical protein UREG_03606 [Uncinocarpus reesii 1704]